MSSARSSATRARPSGCLQPSRCAPVSRVAFWAAAPTETPGRSSTTSSARGESNGVPLIATDGFEYYLGAVVGLFGSACVYGQVLKTRRNNRVIRVERRRRLARRVG